MRLAMYSPRDGAAQPGSGTLGLVEQNVVFDVWSLARRFPQAWPPEGAPRSVKAALAGGETAMTALARLHAEIRMRRPALEREGAPYAWPLARVRLLAPIADPSKFMCVGKNYRAHLEELKRTDLIKEIPDEPTGFVKLNSVIVGHDAEVARPPGIVMFDYEPELVFVIGKPAYRVAAADAMPYVAGVTITNDLTAREIQKREVRSGSRFWTAKNMPGFGPVGPYVITLDEIGDPYALTMSCRVNGGLRLSFQTADAIHKIPAIVEHFSRYMPLEPGDMFATGSPPGVAVGQPNAHELFLKPGDVVEATIDGVATLATRIV